MVQIYVHLPWRAFTRSPFFLQSVMWNLSSTFLMYSVWFFWIWFLFLLICMPKKAIQFLLGLYLWQRKLLTSLDEDRWKLAMIISFTHTMIIFFVSPVLLVYRQGTARDCVNLSLINWDWRNVFQFLPLCFNQYKGLLNFKTDCSSFSPFTVYPSGCSTYTFQSIGVLKYAI